MKYLCLGYLNAKMWAAMSEGERDAVLEEGQDAGATVLMPAGDMLWATATES